MPAGSDFWARAWVDPNNETARSAGMNRGNGIENCIAAFSGEHVKCQTGILKPPGLFRRTIRTALQQIRSSHPGRAFLYLVCFSSRTKSSGCAGETTTFRLGNVRITVCFGSVTNARY